MKSGFSPEAILLVRAATFLQRLFIGWRLLCSAHAAARACQETLRFSRRNPECQRDLLQWHTMDLVHEQDFTLAPNEPADKLVVRQYAYVGCVAQHEGVTEGKGRDN